ncbi:MAG: non-canonical purine NTP pyrophosphatase [Sphaerochaetaceae bacterium]|nr:non-canonical purine NTP pyrophosphatase [Sphaerochaetaceae bacterium]
MEMLFASGNSHKREELERIFSGRHTLILPQEAGLAFDFEETSETFAGNALGKALALYQVGDGRPVVADDSGLVVPALGGAPGVRTARYGSEQFGHLLEAHERNLFLLKNMEGLEGEQRKASFVCAMALVFSPQRLFIVQEEVEGHIVDRETGTGGFGYDPVFFVDEAGTTMAALPGNKKDTYSHRGRAVRRLLALLDTL